MNIIKRLQAADGQITESTGLIKASTPLISSLSASAEKVTIAEIEPRGLVLMCDAGHLELSWDAENDRDVKLIIERKMSKGMRFFKMQPILGGLIDIKRKIATPDDIRDYKFRVKDDDIRELLNRGNARLFRNGSDIYETQCAVNNAQEAVQTRTIGVPSFAGG